MHMKALKRGLPPMHPGELLADVLPATGKTITEVADLIGISRQMLSMIVNGHARLLVPFGIAAILAAAVGQHAQQLNLMAVEEWQDPVVQKIGRRDWRLAIIELGEGHLGVGVDEGLLVDPPHALQIADIERILAAAVARMLALELAVGPPSRPWPFRAPRLGP